MRHLALVVLAVLWVAAAPAQAETKTAPDGFGPIKFGMTKEEAWAAIGGEGEWTQDDELTYTFIPPRGVTGVPEVPVIQLFVDGRASGAVVDLLLDSASIDECLIALRSVVSYIALRYHARPVHTETRSSGSWKRSKSSYMFLFENESYIDVQFYQFYPNAEDVMHCDIGLLYSATSPYQGKVPF